MKTKQLRYCTYKELEEWLVNLQDIPGKYPSSKRSAIRNELRRREKYLNKTKEVNKNESNRMEDRFE